MTDWVGLNELANNPDLTLVAFIAFVLVAVLGIRFGLYAYWNGRANTVDAQVPLWGYLILLGVSAMLYGLFGVLRITLTIFGEVFLNLASGFILAVVLCLALALRAVHSSAAFERSESQPTSLLDSRWVVVAFGLVVVGSTAGMVLAPSLRRPFAGVHAVAGTVFLAVGYRYGQGQLARIEVQGTLLDTLLRHLLPVLLFASLVPILEFAWVAGLDRTVVLYLQIIFVIMTATTLMTATIKLRQHLTGFQS